MLTHPYNRPVLQANFEYPLLFTFMKLTQDWQNIVILARINELKSPFCAIFSNLF